ncbi:speedy protein E4-like [Manis pentadactyla]|uniref:speedy protein E4-like n=1 Tax=Manis pentadactyla TaxID=143292 RepID=UPI00255D09CC|nr:speedy protein E4-like [Manis pentadactyla]
MASVPSSSQAVRQRPQPGPSGHQPDVMLDAQRPGPPAAQAHSSPPPEGSGRRTQRERSAALQESEEAATGEEDAWDLDMLCGLKMRLKRRRVSPVLPEHHEAFKRLLGDLVVKIFLAWDKNLRVSDKYLLAMVIVYFSRAGLPSGQYQRIHFFIALYLANDMEEDDEGPKQDILWLLYGNDRSQRLLFHQQRVQFAQSMGWKAWVSREECEEIQAFDPELPVWKRDRSLLAV